MSGRGIKKLNAEQQIEFAQRIAWFWKPGEVLDYFKNNLFFGAARAPSYPLTNIFRVGSNKRRGLGIRERKIMMEIKRLL